MDDAHLLIDLSKRCCNGFSIKGNRGAGMSRQDQRGLWQRKELVQAVVERRGAISRLVLVGIQVGAPDACGKEGISCEEQLVVEQVAGTFLCVSGGKQCGEQHAPGLECVTITDRREGKGDTVLIREKEHGSAHLSKLA